VGRVRRQPYRTSVHGNYCRASLQSSSCALGSWERLGLEASVFCGPDFGDSEMYRAGNAEVLHDSLPCDISASCSEFLCQRRFDQGHPASHPLYLVSWREHSAIGALDQLASSLASLASSSRPSFLRHCLTILPTEGCHEYIISSRTVDPGRSRDDL